MAMAQPRHKLLVHIPRALGGLHKVIVKVHHEDQCVRSFAGHMPDRPGEAKHLVSPTQARHRPVLWAAPGRPAPDETSGNNIDNRPEFEIPVPQHRW